MEGWNSFFVGINCLTRVVLFSWALMFADRLKSFDLMNHKMYYEYDQRGIVLHQEFWLHNEMEDETIRLHGFTWFRVHRPLLNKNRGKVITYIDSSCTKFVKMIRMHTDLRINHSIFQFLFKFVSRYSLLTTAKHPYSHFKFLKHCEILAIPNQFHVTVTIPMLDCWCSRDWETLLAHTLMSSETSALETTKNH